MAHHIKHERSGTIFFTTIAFFTLTTISVLAFLYAQINDAPLPKDTLFWFSLSFISGVMTIFLPCTLPLAYVTVPIAREKRSLRALGMILLFAVGVALILSFYGAAVGAIGGLLLGTFPIAALQAIVPWVYLLGGIFAYALSLGELGLLSLRMPSYAGMSPAFIRSRKSGSKMFFMGLFLGNIGIGCPLPVVPLLLMSAILSGSASFGALLFLVHALGRIFPLLILLALSLFNINGLEWLTQNKDKYDRTSGWVFVIFTSLLITLGAYSSAWFYSTQLYMWVATLLYAISPMLLEASTPFAPSGVLAYVDQQGGSMLFLILILIPIWWSYLRERWIVFGHPLHHAQALEGKIERLLEEQRGLEATLHIPEGKQHERVRVISHRIEVLLTERRILEESMRFSSEASLRSNALQLAEERSVALRRNWYLTLTLLLIVLVTLLM